VATSAPDNVADLIRARADDESTGLLVGDVRWSWRKVVARSEATAHHLLALRRPGPFHVGILMDNTPDYLFALFATALAGGVAVGINNTRRAEQLALDISHTDCQVVLTGKDNQHLITDLDLGDSIVHLVDGPEWQSRIDGCSKEGRTRVTVDPSDLFTLIFTSGSTGAPKAVQMSHGRAADLSTRWSWVTADDIVYCAMPLFHTNALTAMMLPALTNGGAVALRARFSASEFMPDVRRYGATFFSTAGRALSYILATPEQPDDRDHEIKFALAAESSPADMKAFRHRFGIRCLGGYSSSENAITMSPIKGMPKDALGRPQDGTDAAIINQTTLDECPRAIIDADGRLLNAQDAIGEIVGRNVADRFEGYYRNPEANAVRVRNGWYWSGDLGYRTPDGIFFFAGRTNEWLRVDSENFAVAAVERILARFEPARAVAVFAVPDERTADDQVMAAYELHDGKTFDPTSFAEFLATQSDLGTKWAPRYIRITTLPVGATNKIDKIVLRRQRWNTTDPVYWKPDRHTGFRPFTPDDLRALEERFSEHGRSPSRP
jgi:fatty-acyl-CoA synthase